MKKVLLNQISTPRFTDYMEYVTITGLGSYNPYKIPLWILKLMREDPQISFGLIALKAPIMSANYYIEDDEEGEPPVKPEIKKWVTKLLNKLILPKLFGVGLNCIDYGFQPFEILWRPVREGNKRGYEVKDLFEIEPDRVELKYDDNTGEYLGFTTSGSLKVVPKNKSFIFTHKQEYQKLEGKAVPKYAYIPWYHCCFMYLAAMRYFEARGTPPMVGMAPPTPNIGHDPDALPADVAEDNLNTLAEQMLTLRSGGVAVLPFDPDDVSKANRWAISVLNDDKRGDMFLDFIRHLEMKMLRGMWIPERHLTQDAKGTGSYAMAAEHSNSFYELLECLIRDVYLREVNNHLIPRVVDPLFGVQKAYPRLGCTGVSKEIKRLLYESFLTMLKTERGEITRENSIARFIDVEKVLKKVKIPMLAEKDRPPVDVKSEPKEPLQDAPDALLRDRGRIPEEGSPERDAKREKETGND